ncbi:tumor necrosis factor receptor superfamily member 5 [Eucyclogobius newberryi]|uniref:tumor necrosis factor receptor superfamily member 5 n=1 Tax=Eucyclogobius newberryi TaxID=166745 RepID=UPI003B58F9C6
MRLALSLWTLAALVAADPLCDPEKQYLLHGECCEMCKPGTSMTSSGNCRNPECKDCEENEYMDEYNKEPVCNQQPYCDTNLNFELGWFSSKTQRGTCLCKGGFHCSGATCRICAAHTECGRGSGAKTIGGQTQDTECEKCPEGTISDQTSWNATCECAPGYKPQEGSSKSNRVCEPQRGHVGLIVALTVLIVLVAIAAVIVYFKCKSRTRYGQPENMNGVDIYTGDYRLTVEEEEEMKKGPIIACPTDEEPVRSLPEESEYSDGTVLTLNRDILSQDSKGHIVSQPESNGRSTMAFNWAAATGDFENAR